MTLAVTPFTDLDALHAAFVAQQAVLTAERAERSRINGELAAERAEKERVIEQNDRLRQIIGQLQRMQFGKRSETVDPGQFTLALEELEQAVAAAEAEQRKREPAAKREPVKRPSQGRASLPGHLPRIELVVEPQDMACPCCGGAMHVIGEDRSERLDVIPAQYQVIVTRRPKYACRSCESAVVQAPAPARLIEGGLPTEQLVRSQVEIGCVLSAAAAVGAMDANVRLALDYAKSRIAFGRPIGSFQAVKHVLADSSMFLEMCKGIVAAAAGALGRGAPDGPSLAHAAASFVGERGIELTQTCFQVFGGIGYTWEHDQHLFLRRIAAEAAAFGQPAWHRQELFDLAGLG